MTGFFNLNKAEGVNSTALVNRIKRLTCTPSGHMGTLDPLASGVLPVGVGKATRLFDYFLGKRKRYRARFRFGATTTTLDCEGEVTYGGGIPTPEEICAVLPTFLGGIDQVPPLYSAKVINGVRCYRLARRGETVTLPPKRVNVFSFTLKGQTATDEFEFEIECGGGTYIRSLARDLAKKLGTLGYMSALCRTQSGVFTLDTAVEIEMLTEDNFAQYLIPTESVLPFPVLPKEETKEKLFHGLIAETNLADGAYKVMKDGEFYGVATATRGELKITKKLC